MTNKTILGKCPRCNDEAEFKIPEHWDLTGERCPECNKRLNLFEVTTKTVREVKAIKNEPR